MRFWMEASSVILLFCLLVVLEGGAKMNYTMSSRPLMLKRQSKTIHSSVLAVKKADRNLSVDIERKPSFAKKPRDKIFGMVRKSQYTALSENRNNNTVRKPQRNFQDKLWSNIDPERKRQQVRNKSKTSKGNSITRMKQQRNKTRLHTGLQAGKAKSEIIYKTPNGEDHLAIDNMKQVSQPVQSVIPQINPIIPSKTFLVTVYGDQIEGAAERLHNAVTQQRPRKCESPSCPQTGGQGLTVFPNAGRPFGANGCICPCCFCSCSQPGYEKYNCGCQSRPPQPCPCSPTFNTGVQSPTTSFVISNSSPGTNAVTTGNQVTPWPGGTSSCPCPCCPCACAQPQMYPNYQCGCVSQPPTPCPCSNQGLYYDQSGSENNVARSQENSPYPSSANNNAPQLPGYNPYVSTANTNAPQGPGYSPYPSTFNNDILGYPVSNPTNNAPLVHRFQAGDFTFDNTCDCYCCPCSCPGNEYVAYDNNHCTCSLDKPCSCRRSDVKTGHSSNT